MNKKILITGAIFGIIAICLGAFAAHGLKQIVSQESVTSFETGVRYQMYHAFFLLLIGATSIIEMKWKKPLFYLVILGVLFFSGSIYALATNDLSSFDFKKIAMITPIGGLLLIIAWGVLLLGIIKGHRNHSK